MKRTLKAGFFTVCMTALATAPIVTITTIATADAAYAKNGNGNGNGNGGGNSNAGGNGNGKGNDKSASARGNSGKVKSKGQGNTRSASKGGPKSLNEFFQKLTGQDKKSNSSVASRGNAGAASSKAVRQTIPTEIAEAPAKRGGKRVNGLHPSQLGNMNGALNANVNAVLAHIRNGNTNGPVGLVAALAVAKDGAEGAQDVLDIEAGYLLLDDALTGSAFAEEEDPLAAYLMSLDDARTGAEDPAVEAALDALATAGDDADIEALEQALTDALEASPNLTTDDKSIEAYQASLDQAETDARDPAIDDALAGLATDEDGETIERPDGDAVDMATEALEDLTAAEDMVVEVWNKSDAATEEDTDALLMALHERIDRDADLIGETIDATEVAEDDGDADADDMDDDLAECEEGETCEDGEIEELASAN